MKNSPLLTTPLGPIKAFILLNGGRGPLLGLRPPSPPLRIAGNVESSQISANVKGQIPTPRSTTACALSVKLLLGDAWKFSLKIVDSNKLSHLQLTQVFWVDNFEVTLLFSHQSLQPLIFPRGLNVSPHQVSAPVPGPFFCSHLPSPLRSCWQPPALVMLTHSTC